MEALSGTSLNKKMDIGLMRKAGSGGDLGKVFINFADINFRQSFGKESLGDYFQGPLKDLDLLLILQVKIHVHLSVYAGIVNYNIVK